MKMIVKSLALATVMSSPVLLAGCTHSTGGQVPQESDHHLNSDDADKNGVCPMHPDVTGKVGDICSKCGMKLEAVNEESAANHNAYFMDFKATPEVRANEASVLSLTPSIKGKSESVALDIQHGKKIHLIIVSKDLSYFDHVHPELQADGSYQVRVLPKGAAYTEGKFHNETFFANGGEYFLFADYLPTRANHQLERIVLPVAGNPLPATRFTTEKLTSNVDGYEVSLRTEGGKFYNEGMTHMAAVVKKDGVEMVPSDFEDFLAAKAHVVMINENTKDYLHVHPEIVNGRLSLHTTFGATGIFRGWLQFQTHGVVHTADFVLDVAKGGYADEKPSHSHKH